jgi:tetratricopeptide (TPR) repeat protein
MNKLLMKTIAIFCLVGISTRSSLAAWPYPGEDPRERHILPSNIPPMSPTDTCKNRVVFDNGILKEILQRRIGPDLDERNHKKAIDRLNALLKATQRLPITQVRSDLLVGLFNPYYSIYDGAVVPDLESISSYRENDRLLEVIVKRSLVDPQIQIEPLLRSIEQLNQSLQLPHGVPKTIVFIRLSQLYSLLAEQKTQSKSVFHQRASVQLNQAYQTIQVIRNPSLKLNMLLILGRRYAAIGEMVSAQKLYQEILPRFKSFQLSDSSESNNRVDLLIKFQTQLGRFEEAWATVSAMGKINGMGDRDELIAAMLQSQSPESVLPYLQKIPEPKERNAGPGLPDRGLQQSKAQALGKFAIAFTRQGQSERGYKLMKQAIAMMPLVEQHGDVTQGWSPETPIRRSIDLSAVLPLLLDYARIGQLESALEIAENIQSPATAVGLKALMASEYIQQGKIDQAQTLISDLNVQVKQISQNETYPLVQEVFAALMDKQQYQLAWTILQSIDTKVWERYLNSLTSTAPLAWPFLDAMHRWQGEIIQAAIADQRYDIALAAAGDNAELLRIATLPNVKVGRVAESLEAARRTKRPDQKAGILAVIALQLEQLGQRQQAQAIWSEAIDTAQQLKDFNQRVYALASVAAKLQYTDRQTQVDALLRQILVIDDAVRNSSSYRYHPIIHGIMEFLLWGEGAPRLAIRLIEKMPPGVRREQHQVSLFQNLLSLHDEYIPEAETILAIMPKSALKIRSQIALADAYFTWGKMEQSTALLTKTLADLKQLQNKEILKTLRALEPSTRMSGFLRRNTVLWLRKGDNRSNLMGYIALGYAKLNSYQQATRIVQMIPDPTIQRQWRSHLMCYQQ